MRVPTTAIFFLIKNGESKGWFQKFMRADGVLLNTCMYRLYMKLCQVMSSGVTYSRQSGSICLNYNHLSNHWQHTKLCI